MKTRNLPLKVMFTAALFSTALAAAAQTLLLSNGFNSASLPGGWETNAYAAGTGVGTDPIISFVASSTYSNATPYEGSYFVKFNSWDCRTNAQLRLVSPVINAGSSTNLSVQFAWFQDPRTNKDAEGVTLQWTTNNWATASNVAPFQMRRGTPTNWVLRHLALPVQAISTNLRVGLLFNSSYGNNCYVDDLRVFASAPVTNYPYSENFEDGLGIWSCGPGADFTWTRWSGYTPSGAVAGQTTGVSAAQSGSSYLYTEATDPNYPSKTALLAAPFDFSSLQEPRLWFYYHMCGASIGTLYVEVSPNGGASWQLAWSKTGQQQPYSTNGWARQSVNLIAYGGMTNVKIRFRGVTGADGLGDMAIDSVSVTESVNIRSQGFEGTDANPWTYVLSPDAQGAVVTTSRVSSGTHALRLQGSINGATNVDITFDNTSLAGYTNVTVLVPFGADGPDSGDDLHFYVSYDGGANWNGTYGTQIGDGYNDLNLAFGQYTPTNTVAGGNPYILAVPAGSTQLMVRVRFYDASANNTGDFYFLDDVKVMGAPLGTEDCPDALDAVCVNGGSPTNGAHVTAGAAYTKTWTMSNSGTATWSSNSACSFTFGRGDNPASSSVVHFAAAESVAPGATKDFSVSFTAPTNGGMCAGFWNLRRNGTNFGERVWLDVVVDTPDIAITNAQTEFSSGTTTAGLGGTKHSTVVGTMRWTNALTGASGSFAAASPWSVSGITLASGDNPITVSGTNSAGVAGAATIVLTRLAAPTVTISTTDATVSNSVTSTSIAGTAGSSVVGNLAWTNSLGGSGTVPASTSWTISGVALAVGTNLITVTATNAAGESASDAVQFIRAASAASGTLIDEPFDTSPTAPAGWTFSGISESYTTVTNSGRTPPSVKFDSDGDYLISPAFSGGTNLQFWMRANPSAGTLATGTFVVAQYVGGGWSTVYAVTNPSKTGANHTTPISASATQLKFTWNKTYGNIAFDDVIVTASKSAGAVFLLDLTQAYNGSARTVSATTMPAGLTVNFTYAGNAWAPTNIGRYAVVGTINNASYQGSTNGTLAVTEVIGSGAVVTNDVQVAFGPLVSGSNYVLQYRASLTTGDWVTVTNRVGAGEASATLTHTNSVGDFGYYRVLGITGPSAQLWGYARLDKPGNAKLNIVAIPFVTSNQTLNSLMDPLQFSGHYNNAGLADQIMIWDAGPQTYVNLALYDLRAFGAQYASNTGWKAVSGFGPTSAYINPLLPPGSAVWIRGSTTNDRKVAVAGEVGMAAAATNAIVQGLQLIGNPFSEQVALSNLTIHVNATGSYNNAGLADQIMIWDAGSQGYVNLALYDLRSFGAEYDYLTGWKPVAGFGPTSAYVNVTLKPGQGFWFRAVNGSFQWVETNEYRATFE